MADSLIFSPNKDHDSLFCVVKSSHSVNNTHCEKHNPFENSFGVRGVFLDISKDFDKVLLVGLYSN